MWPKLIPIPVMNKMRYLEGLPEGMYYCSAPRRDPELFEKFKNELTITKEVPIHHLKDGLKDPSNVLEPAQCEPFYEFFSHEVVDEKDLPISLFDRSGWTYRWEAGGAKGLDWVHARSNNTALRDAEAQCEEGSRHALHRRRYGYRDVPGASVRTAS